MKDFWLGIIGAQVFLIVSYTLLALIWAVLVGAGCVAAA
tara:strand:+ start:383 stop:499 length:117 start_codon:yes stop_codon:yes gene_type:complete